MKNQNIEENQEVLTKKKYKFLLKSLKEDKNNFRNNKVILTPMFSRKALILRY